MNMVKKKRCKKCNNSGWIYDIEDGFEVVKRCDCFKLIRKERLLEEARIPFRYKHCTFENFDVKGKSKGYLNPNPEKNQVSLEMARKIAEDFVCLYPKVKKGLFFMGKCGVGKTHLAVAIIMELINRKGIPCVFYDFRDLLTEIKSTYSAEYTISETSVLAPVLEKEIIVLDELGAQKVTEWMRDTLTHIINQRYSNNKLVILTSNWLDEADEEEDTLIERIGYRLRSRLYEMCELIEIIGEDYRRRE